MIVNEWIRAVIARDALEELAPHLIEERNLIVVVSDEVCEARFDLDIEIFG